MSNEISVPTVSTAPTRSEGFADPTATLTSPPLAATTETPPTPAPKEPGKLEWANKFNTLARQERELQKARDALKAEREQLKPYQNAREAAQKNPLEALRAMGLTYDQMTDYLLTNKLPTPEPGEDVKAVKAELEAFKKQLEDKETTAKQAQRDQQILSYKTQIGSAITEKAADFELIASNGDEGIDLVFETAVQYWQQTGEEPKLEEILKTVEEHYESALEKLLNLNKVKAKTSPVVPSEPSALAPQVNKAPTVTVQKTLTNNLTPRTEPANPGTPVSREESLKRAAALIKWV